MEIKLFLVAHMSVWKTIGVVFIVFILLSLIALINRIFYLRRIHLMDIRNLGQQKESEVAAIRTRMIREGTMRYVRGVADGFIKETERVGDERIQRHKLEYWHDLIASVITAITRALSKRT